MNQTQLDIVSVGMFFATLIFAPNVAAVVGPYMVIILASTIGASFALARRESTTKGAAAWFFFRVNGLAVLMTVGFAVVASAFWPIVNQRVLLAPIAFLIGMVGDSWPGLALWASRKLNALVDGLIKLKTGGNGGSGGGA